MVTIINIILSTGVPTENQLSNSDLNNDEVINILDVVILVNLILN